MSAADASLFGEQLTAVLDEYPGKQCDLADELGVTPTTICNWKRGLHIPHGGTLEALANRLGVGVGELIGRQPAANSQPQGGQQDDVGADGELDERLAALDLMGSLEALQRAAPEIRRLGEALPDLMEVLAAAQRRRGGSAPRD